MSLMAALAISALLAVQMAAGHDPALAAKSKPKPKPHSAQSPAAPAPAPVVTRSS